MMDPSRDFILLCSTHSFFHCGLCLFFIYSDKRQKIMDRLKKKKGGIKQKAMEKSTKTLSTNPDTHSWASQT